MSAQISRSIESLEDRRLFAVAVGLTNNNVLVEFDTARPSQIVKAVEVTGLQSGESLVSVDFRPATGVLYGLGSDSRLYALNRNTGAATQVGAQFSVLLEGTKFSIDFNPFADALRIVSNTEQNLRVNINTGAVVDTDLNTGGVQPDGDLAYAVGDAGNGLDPLIAAIGYSSNFSGTASTTLYGIDSERNVLVTQGSTSSAPISPNGGSLLTVGALGIDVTTRLAMDVTTTSRGNEAIIVAGVSGADGTGVYRVDLTTGRATFVGNVAVRRPLIGVALAGTDNNVLALSTSNRLIRFNTGDPNNSASSLRVRLPEGETLQAIDFRPRTNQLYGLSDASQIYIINAVNGRVTALDQPIGQELVGTSFAMDFNPFADAIRITSNSGENLRVNATTGALVLADGNIAFAGTDTNASATPSLTAASYTNNADLTPSTTLFGIDTTTDSLVTQGSLNSAPISPNSGQLFTVGSIGFGVEASAGMDIVTRNGINQAVAILQPSNGSRVGLYDVNLSNGRTVRIGSLPRGIYSDVAIVPDGVALA